MRWLAIYGCAGGDLLVGAKASGTLTACSFAPPVDRRDRSVAVEHRRYWDAAGAFGPFRRWREAAAEPCRSCDYLALCRGGCRVVSGPRLGRSGRARSRVPARDRPHGRRVRLPVL